MPHHVRAHSVGDDVHAADEPSSVVGQGLGTHDCPVTRRHRSPKAVETLTPSLAVTLGGLVEKRKLSIEVRLEDQIVGAEDHTLLGAMSTVDKGGDPLAPFNP